MVDTARSSSLDHLLQTRLEDHEKRAVRRRLRPLDSGIGPRVLVDGRSVIQLCSNDYLGLAAHPAVTRAAADAIPGCRFTVMKGIGHFPMVENYPLFRGYLLEELASMA